MDFASSVFQRESNLTAATTSHAQSMRDAVSGKAATAKDLATVPISVQDCDADKENPTSARVANHKQTGKGLEIVYKPNAAALKKAKEALVLRKD